MNKKELATFATQEKKLYLRLQYTKRRAKHFYNFAVKHRKQGNIHQAKLFWKYCKEECVNAEKAFTAWEALFDLKSLLQLPIEKYLHAVDEKALAKEKWEYDNSFDDVKKYVPWSFIWAVKKTAKIDQGGVQHD